jgi:hypothetical protein
MATTLAMTEEAVRTITVRFIDRGRTAWDSGRSYQMRPASVAYLTTGRNRESGEITVGVGLRERRNGLVELSFDFWRIDYNLSYAATECLEQRWLSLCVALPRPVRRKMGFAAFGRCFSTFNVPMEQASDWRKFLTKLLGDPASYVDIRARKSP